MCETQVQSPKCVFGHQTTYFISRADKENKKQAILQTPKVIREVLRAHNHGSQKWSPVPNVFGGKKSNNRSQNHQLLVSSFVKTVNS
jgi:hypothetical protein